MTVRTCIWLLGGLCLAMISAPCRGQAAGTGSDDAVVQAELKMLRATVARQAQELEALRAELAVLRKQIPAAAEPVAVPAAPAAPAPAAPAKHKIKSILFLMDAQGGFAAWGAARTDFTRALDQLQPGQAFNVYLHGSKGVTALQRGYFVEPTPENRRRVDSFLTSSTSLSGNLEEGLSYAIKQRPDLICLLSVGHVKDFEATLKTVREQNVSPRIPINTTLKYVAHGPAVQKHFLWQLARDSGGRCTNADGSDADEPVVPAVVAPAQKPAPAPAPDLFRLK